jgi:hypothetical protein
VTWVYLFVAGIFEICFALGLKYSERLHAPLAHFGHGGRGGAQLLPAVGLHEEPAGRGVTPVRPSATMAAW